MLRVCMNRRNDSERSLRILIEISQSVPSGRGRKDRDRRD